MQGHILDLYPGQPGEMVVWLKLLNGDAVRLVDRWSPSIFIGTDTKSDFAVPLQALRGDFEWTRTVRRRERVSDSAESEVVEAKLKDAKRAQHVAARIERLGPFGTFRLYNADVPPNQSYLYEHELFPLALCEVERKGDRLRWELDDDVWAYDYDSPNLRKVELEVQVAQEGKLPKPTDEIDNITLKSDRGTMAIDGESEADKLLELVKAIREADPDFILTNDGDTFLFPYLIKRAEHNGIPSALALDRDGIPMKLPSKAGTSYFSYGQIHYKPSAMKLFGRVHLDCNTSFAYSEAGFDGLFELSRICRMPLHTSSRASIGKALSSLQFYHASKMGLLVPWKPTLVEHFKDRNELLMADRGGFIFEPKVGVHENVGELDFSCLVKDSRVVTRDGEKPISEINEGDEVLTPFGWQKASTIHEYRINEKVVRLTLSDGKQITCTTHHKFPVLVRDVFEEKTADRIRRGNRLIVADPLPILQNDDLACLFGAFTAEGGRLRRDQKYLDKSRKKFRISHLYRVEFSINKHEIDFRNFITGTLSKIYPNVHIYTRTKRGSDGITLVVAQKAVVADFLSRYNTFIANEYHSQDEEASFVRGFFEGDGGVNKKRNTVQCDQSSKNHSKLDVVCKYLRELDIKYRVGRYINKHGFSSNPTDFLELSGLEAVVRYYTEIGFISEIKQRALRQAILTRIRKAKNYPRPRLGLYAKARKNNALSFIHETHVIRKQTLDYDDRVYDLTLEWAEFPYYFADGILTHNSLYPNIMYRKNISAETVRCSCCPDSKSRVPELDWNVCEKRKGIVPLAIEIIVKKRLRYKELKANASSTAEYDKYNERQAVLKWIGVTCLPGESPVFVKQGGRSKFVRIGDFIDGLVGEKTGVVKCPPDMFVAGLGQDYKAKYSRVANLIKKPNNQNLLSVEMENGRKIIATPDHPFFTLRKGELEVVAAEDLEAGEVIPVARKIPSTILREDRLDLIEHLGELLNAGESLLWRVSGESLKDEIRAKKQELIHAAISEGYSYSAVVSWIKGGIIPLRFLRLLEIDPKSHRTLRIGCGRRGGGRIAWLPAIIEIDERLGFFLGMYVADGSTTKTYVRLDIAFSEPNLLETTKKLAESLFGISAHVYKEREAQMHVVQINSASLVRVLEKIFGLPGSAAKGKLKVPDIIFNCEELTANGFIAGVIAGDGHASKKRKFVDIATASKDFQNQIGFLAAKLGLAFRLGTNREGQTLYTVNFVGPETMRTIGSWEYSKENQKSTIGSWSTESPNTCNHARYLRLPAAESGLFTLAKATRTSSEPHVLEGSRTCPVQVEKKLARMRSKRPSGAQNEQISKVDRLLNSDLGFVRIRKITRTDSLPEYVYCFQLADDEVPGFFAGEGAILVHNCFGYLGFNNAKFGRIDAHIAVCAWDRRTLLDTARIAERRGFEVLHGIVDSLWVKKERANEDDYHDLRAEIERETGFAMSFEGIYKWVAFLPSKVEPGIPVLNRYFGAYRTGELKVRGIEARRHDTPLAFAKCQMEVLRVLATAGTIEEARAKIAECVEIFLSHAEALAHHEIPASELAFTTNLSKAPEEYTTMTVQHAALKQLVKEGASLHAGEGIRYVITDYGGKDSKRATPLDMIRDETKYDSRRYIRLLAETCASVLECFDPRCTAEGLTNSYEARRSGSLTT